MPVAIAALLVDVWERRRSDTSWGHHTHVHEPTGGSRPQV